MLFISYYFITFRLHILIYNIVYSIQCLVFVCCARAGVSEMNILFLFREPVSLYRNIDNTAIAIIMVNVSSVGVINMHTHIQLVIAPHTKERQKNRNKTTQKQIDLMAMLLVACAHHNKPISKLNRNRHMCTQLKTFQFFSLFVF